MVSKLNGYKSIIIHFRHAKQDQEEHEREKVRNNIREKYGITKKTESYVDLKTNQVID